MTYPKRLNRNLCVEALLYVLLSLLSACWPGPDPEPPFVPVQNNIWFISVYQYDSNSQVLIPAIERSYFQKSISEIAVLWDVGSLSSHDQDSLYVRIEHNSTVIAPSIWDGAINYEYPSGRILGAGTLVVSEETFGSATGLPTDQQVNAIDGVFYRFEGTRFENTLHMRFPEPIDHLFFVVSPANGQPAPSVAGTSPGPATQVSVDPGVVVFDFDQPMAIDTPFPEFTVQHDLGVATTVSFISGARLEIRLADPLAAASNYRVTLNPAGFAPLLRSESGRVLPEYTLTFSTQ